MAVRQEEDKGSQLFYTTELHILRAQSQNCEFNIYFSLKKAWDMRLGLVQNLENL